MPRSGKNPRAMGLTHQGTLVAVAFFCNPRTSGMQRRYSRELLRLAFLEDIRVVGGASRLIKAFMATDPWDLFTYQDTSGEASNVYEVSGMKLRGPLWPMKKILVKDGLTHETAQDNRCDWFSLDQVVRYGPDALLGTSLGEVFKENGARKTNVEIFVEDCGYHLEEIPGDRVYEWRNPKTRFYVYRITSSSQEGYYIGRHVTRLEPREEILLDDGYWGSGGRKFQSWKASMPSGSLRKKIIKICSTWEETVALEEKLIGTAYRDDPLCMNDMPGGAGTAPFFPKPEEKLCTVHGLVLHRGSSCMTCSSRGAFSTLECPIHGLTSHQKGVCFKCIVALYMSKAQCPLHGEVSHRKGRCMVCWNRNSLQVKACNVHGSTKFRGDRCLRCVSLLTVSTEICTVHGSTSFRGGKCSKCSKASQKETRECPLHGLTAFYAGKCASCVTEKTLRKGVCSVHGESSFRGDICVKCNLKDKKVYREALCPLHGKTTFRREGCLKCIAQNSLTTKHCPKHGEVLHKGDRCSTCQTEALVKKGVCPTHGETTFVGDLCRTCVNLKAVSYRECPLHGRVKFQGDKCCKCTSAKTIESRRITCTLHGVVVANANGACMKCHRKPPKKGSCSLHGEVRILKNGDCSKCHAQKQLHDALCEVHGVTRFKGSSCCQCTAEKTAHKRFHGEKAREDCRYCKAR